MGGPLVLGIDSSTQSVKVELRTLDDGELVSSSSARHPLTTPPVSEQDPRSWWDALVRAVSDLGDHRNRVVAMSVAGQQHGLVLLDDSGAVLRPAKLWNDTTSAPQGDRLVAAIGAERWAELTGSVPVAAFTITKLAWVAEHEPDVLARTGRVMLPHDYLTWRLTGEHVTDRGDASGTGWFDPVSGCVVVEALKTATGVEDGWLGRLPTVLAHDQPAGTITSQAAQALGLPEGLVVGPGTGDNMAAALGLGLRSGDIAISLGTSGTTYAVSSTPTRDPSGAIAGFADATGHYLPLVCTLNATKVTDTVARWLGTDASGLAALALEAVDDPGTVSLAPYFDGERTPNLPAATGVFVGLTNDTTRGQLALAAYDGVLRGLVHAVDLLRTAGAMVDGRAFLIGGGARSAAYRRRAADLLGREVLVSGMDEAVAVGAAVQAAAVLGRSLATITTDWRLGAGAATAPSPNDRSRLHRSERSQDRS